MPEANTPSSRHLQVVTCGRRHMSGCSRDRAIAEALRTAVFVGALQRPAIQWFYAGYPQAGKSGILNVHNSLLRTNSQVRKFGRFQLNLMTAAAHFSRNNPQTCAQPCPQLARKQPTGAGTYRAQNARKKRRVRGSKGCCDQLGEITGADTPGRSRSARHRQGR